MIRLPAVEYHAAVNLAAAARLLGELGPSATVVAGGTDLFPKMKRRQTEPKTVIDLGGVDELRGVRTGEDGTVAIGALTTLRELAASPVVPRALATAAGLVASPQIRTVATVGGNLCLDTRCNWYDMSDEWRVAAGRCLKDGGDVCWVAPRGDRCWAVSSSDLAPVAVALDAELRLVSARGERTVPAAGHFADDGLAPLTMARDEILTEVVLPRPHAWGTAYHKLRRRGDIDFPIFGAAVALHVDDAGVCTAARVAIGAVASAPVRARDAEAELIGTRLEPEAIEQAAATAAKHVRPFDNTDLGSRYRKWMAPVYAARAMRDAAADLGAG